MKKLFFSLLCLSFLVAFSSCADFQRVRNEGVMYSTDPKITVVLSDEAPAWDHGEYTKDDGTIINIEFRAARGTFFIYEVNENKEIVGTLFNGKYVERGDVLTLKCSDGREIILRNTGDGSPS